MGPLILDTGAWLLALAGDEPYAQILEDSSPVYVPGLVLAEVDYHLRDRRAAMNRILEDIAEQGSVYEPPTLADLKRSSEIDQKFSEVRLGLVDASVAALAERLRVWRVLTIDSDFSVVRLGIHWERGLELVVPVHRSRRRHPPSR